MFKLVFKSINWRFVALKTSLHNVTCWAQYTLLFWLSSSYPVLIKEGGRHKETETDQRLPLYKALLRCVPFQEVCAAAIWVTMHSPQDQKNFTLFFPLAKMQRPLKLPAQLANKIKHTTFWHIFSLSLEVSIGKNKMLVCMQQWLYEPCITARVLCHLKPKLTWQELGKKFLKRGGYMAVLFILNNVLYTVSLCIFVGTTTWFCIHVILTTLGSPGFMRPK